MAATEDTLRAKVLSLRPPAHVEAERLENAIAARMFGASSDPTRIDRFVVLERLGTGGMGVVYSAYDPRLDRRVALKLLRDSDRVGHIERERLVREAHALARISHPNVVTVHEVGELDEQVFVVMEFVVGSTLAQWVETASPSTAEILDAYRQAGRGLAAAHAAGLVHRDFKPHNAILGEDGRVRVVDFGLAQGERSAGSADDHSPGSPPDAPPRSGKSPHLVITADTPLTRPSALLGTPAYMSPEQYARAPIGPASDQFSFCVSLYQALTGEHPFEASSPMGMATRILEGTLREHRVATKIPAWLLAVLRRGLSVSPEDRFASMDELVAALGRDPAAIRRRWGLGLAFASLAGLCAYALMQRTDAAVPCQGSEQALESLWNEGRREQLRERFAALSPPDEDVAGSRTFETIDAYVDRWRQMHEDTCLAHHRGEQSGALLDKRMACLDRRRVALDSAIAVLAVSDQRTLENASFVVHDLPPVHMCGDLDFLEAELPIPDDAQLARELAAVREGLTRALTLANAGRFDEALRRVRDEEQRARSLDYPPAVAEALLARGRIEMDHAVHDAGHISATLLEAFHTGIGSGSDRVATEALVRRLYIEAIRPGGRSITEEDFALARSLIERLPEPSYVLGLFLNNVGTIAASRGDYDTAREHLRRALEVEQRAPEPNPIEVTDTRLNLAVMSRDETAQLAGLERALESYEDELGARHVRTFDARMILARAIRDPVAAEKRFGDLCDDYERTYPEHRHRIVACRYEQAMRALELRDNDGAIALFERIDEDLRQGSPNALLKLLHAQSRAYALHLRGDSAEAIAVLEPEVRQLARLDTPPWLETPLLQAQLILGQMLVEADRPADAVAELRPAVAALASHVDQRLANADLRHLAHGRIVLARALLEVPGQTPATRAEIAALLDRAADWYRGCGPGPAWRLDHVEQLRRLNADP